MGIKLLGYQGWIEILMITLVYSKRVSVRSNLLHGVVERGTNQLGLYGNEFSFIVQPIEK